MEDSVPHLPKRASIRMWTILVQRSPALRLLMVERLSFRLLMIQRLSLRLLTLPHLRFDYGRPHVTRFDFWRLHIRCFTNWYSNIDRFDFWHRQFLVMGLLRLCHQIPVPLRMLGSQLHNSFLLLRHFVLMLLVTNCCDTRTTGILATFERLLHPCQPR